jgi:hypothetical protein
MDGVDDVVKQLEIDAETATSQPPFPHYEVMLAGIVAVMGIVAVIAGLAASL